MSKSIQPEQLAVSGSEDGEQLALMCWAALNLKIYSDLKWLAHVPNGGFRNKREAAKLKAMGVAPGYPDLNLLVRRGSYSGLFIELKKVKGGVASDKQLEWIEHLRSQGFGACVCHGWLEAKDAIISYLEWKG